MIRMASVADALALLASTGADVQTRIVSLPLAQAAGLRLAEPVVAAVNQPPADVSAMDGYAVRFADLARGGRMAIVDVSRAGVPADRPLGVGEAIRIFTGAHLPTGADHVVIQEDVALEGDRIAIHIPQTQPGNIRRLGRDFHAGAQLVPAGQQMTPGALSLAAAGNVGVLRVHAAPRVGVLANGDELVVAGATLQPGQVVNAIAPALLAQLRLWSVDAIDLGIARDDEADVRNRIATDADLIVSIGGASVGDYDVVRTAFAAAGFDPLLEKIAVKPGKPTWLSRKGRQLVLGLPGNPAAAMVTAQLFLRPLLAAMTGGAPPPAPLGAAITSRALPAAGNREEYLRAVLTLGADGSARVTPAEDQDSSLLSPFLTANALIRRPPDAPAVAAGALVEVMLLA